jgi:hypothetical protein
MALGIEVFVERVLDGSRGIVWDGEGALGGDRIEEVVGVISGVCHHDVCREPLDQRFALRDVAFLARYQGKANRTSQASDGQVYFCAQAAA